jgi:hypothetical protein
LERLWHTKKSARVARLSRVFLLGHGDNLFFEKVMTKTKPIVTATMFEIVDGG